MLAWHCRKTGEVRYTLYARDTSKQQPLSRQQRLTIAHMKLEQTAHLPNKVELAVGMKTMVLSNIAPSIDLANGSCGIITDIILDLRECALPDGSNTIFYNIPLQLSFSIRTTPAIYNFLDYRWGSFRYSPRAVHSVWEELVGLPFTENKWHLRPLTHSPTTSICKPALGVKRA